MEDEKPYWLFLDAQRDGEMKWGLFNYFPDAHYRKAIDRAREEEPVSDGGHLHSGKQETRLYYWVNPETDAALSHTDVDGDEAIPFFDSVRAAEDYLERRVEADDDGQYSQLSLYRARVEKIGDAGDVLTEQSGIDDFGQFTTNSNTADE